MAKSVTIILISYIYLTFVLLNSFTPVNSNPPQNATLKYPPCIDDSDCVDLGYRYACFMYMCYPWKEPNEDHPVCERDWDCWRGTGKCFTHHNLRSVTNSICFKNISSCYSHSNCPEDTYCCGRTCCPRPYYEAWRLFPCSSDFGCKSLNTGDQCCEDNKCCFESNEIPTKKSFETSISTTKSSTTSTTSTSTTTSTTSTTTTSSSSTTTTTTTTTTLSTTSSIPTSTTKEINEVPTQIILESSTTNSEPSTSASDPISSSASSSSQQNHKDTVYFTQKAEGVKSNADGILATRTHILSVLIIIFSLFKVLVSI